jgi:transposase
VVDHHTGRLVWAAAGRDSKTVLAFFDALGEERCKQIELVSCDMATWIAGPVAERCPDAVRCVDPFHVVQLATDALDDVRREVWNEARRAGNMELARELKGARFAVWKNPENLTERQHREARDDPADERQALPRVPPQRSAPADLPGPGRARRAAPRRLARMGQTIPTAVVREARPHDHRPARRHSLRVKHGLSNARVEQLNTQIRLIARQAFGFHSPRPLIALAMLKLAGLCPPLSR